MLELLHRVLFIKPLWGLLLPLCNGGGSEQGSHAVSFARDTTHLRRVHSAAVLVLATTFERLHLGVCCTSIACAGRPCPRRPQHPRPHPCLVACHQQDQKGVRAALASHLEQRRPAGCDAGKTGPVEPAGPAEMVGQLVKGKKRGEVP